MQCLEQGSNTVEDYYNDLHVTLFYCGLEESEDIIMDRFWDGLNRDIQELLMHENCYPMDCLFCLACKAEQKIKRRVAAKINKHMVHIPMIESVVRPTHAPPMATTSVVVSLTSPPAMATSYESDIKGTLKGIDYVHPHEIDICHPTPHTSCVVSPVDLATPSVLEDIATDLNLPCAQTSEIDDVSSAPIVEFNSSIDLCASPEIIADENEPVCLVY